MVSVRRRIWKWTAGVFAGLVILLAVAVGLFRLFLPFVPEYHRQIEALASDAIGRPVLVGSIDARWRLGGPELVFKDATVLNNNGDPMFAAKSGSVGISFTDLIARRELKPGRIVLSGVELEFVRDAAGAWRVSNLPELSPGAGIDRLPQGRLELRDTRIVVHDRGSQKQWTLSDLDLNLHVSGDELRTDGTVQLAESDGRISFEAGFSLGSGMEIGRNWQLLLGADQIALTNLNLPIRDDLPEFVSGDVEFVVTAAASDGQLDHFSATLSGKDIGFHHELTGDLPKLYQRLSGRMDWERQRNGWLLSFSDFNLARNARVWPQSQGSVEFNVAGKRTRVAYVDMQFLRLDDLLPFAAWLPDNEFRTRIFEAAPAGDLLHVTAHATRRDDELIGYSLKTGLRDIQIQPIGSVPGVRGLSGRLLLDTTTGQFEIDSESLVLDFPNLFRGPLQAEVLGDVRWTRDENGLVLKTDNLRAANEDVTARVDVEMTIPSDGSPVRLDLSASGDGGPLTRAGTYLPVGIMGEGVVAWLDDALLAGRVSEPRVEFHGTPGDFPFDDGSGHFLATAKISDAVIHTADDWPRFEEFEADIVFENEGLTIDVHGAEVSGTHIESGQVRFADLPTGILEAEAKATGSLENLIGFVRESPLGAGYEGLQGMQFGGDAATVLDLTLPLTQTDASSLQATVTTDNGALGLEGFSGRLEQIDGTLFVDDFRLSSDGLSASLLGRPVSLAIGNDEIDESLTRASLYGRFDVADLTALTGFPLSTVFDGEADWSVQLWFPENESQWRLAVGSPMQGIAIKLPEPLAKTADESAPLNFEMRFGGDTPDLVTIDDARGLTARLELQNEDDRVTILRGNVEYGTGEPADITATESLVVHGKMPQLDVDAWLAVFELFAGDTDALLLKSADLSAVDMRLFGQSVTNVSLKIDRNPREWLVQIGGDQIEGSVFVPFDRRQTPVVMDMLRLRLSSDEDANPIDQLPPDPRDFPALRLSAKEFSWGDRHFGGLQMDVERIPEGLRILRFGTAASSFRTEGTSEWVVTDTGQRTALDFTIESSDVGETLSALGYGQAVDADDGSAELNVYWNASPGENVYDLVSGDVSIRIGPGVLHDVQPGAGRLFGLLSVAALPRRLSLDFRDVFGSGLAFDRIEGDFRIDRGNAYTENLVLEGPAADIGIVGRTGLGERDYDQTAIVRANFGSGLPLAGAVVAGPGVGAALLIFAKLFEKPLKEMGKVVYRVTGSWDEPVIERIGTADPSAQAQNSGAEASEG